MTNDAMRWLLAGLLALVFAGCSYLPQPLGTSGAESAWRDVGGGVRAYEVPGTRVTCYQADYRSLSCVAQRD
jgi:hypothetical protein